MREETKQMPVLFMLYGVTHCSLDFCKKMFVVSIINQIPFELIK